MLEEKAEDEKTERINILPCCEESEVEERRDIETEHKPSN